MAKKYYWNGIGSITIKKKKYHAGDLLPADIEKATLEKHLKKGEIGQQELDVKADNAITENEQLKKENFKSREIIEASIIEIEKLRKSNKDLAKENEQLKGELDIFKNEKVKK